MKNLAYVRATSTHPNEDAQRHEITLAYHVERWLRDDDSSKSTRIVELPGFSELCRISRRGDTVIVSSTECLGRSVPELLRTLTALQRKGVRVMSIQDGDLQAFRRAVARMLASIDQLEDAVRR